MDFGEKCVTLLNIGLGQPRATPASGPFLQEMAKPVPWSSVFSPLMVLRCGFSVCQTLGPSPFLAKQ